jgi:sugar lactone lactonase YvrE
MKTATIVLSFFLSLVLAPGALAAARIECVAGCGEGSKGSAKAVKFDEPFGVAFDQEGNWYVCEHKGQRIVRVDVAGNATVLAGTGSPGYSGDGGPAVKATLFDPHGLVISKEQQMFIADTESHCIRKVDLKTGIISTIAGTGKAGFAGDGGLATKAEFNGTYALDLDRKRNLIYIADLANRRIRRIDLESDQVTTVAGNGEEGEPLEGAEAAGSPLVDPRAVAIDSRGNVYILEREGNALRVINLDGKIQTLIKSSASRTSSPTAVQAVPELNGPKHLCVDLHDNIIIADAENHLIRRFNPKTGRITTIAGTGKQGSRLVSDDPLKTSLNRPHGVFVHPSGALYISDSYNHRILKMTGWETAH